MNVKKILFGALIAAAAFVAPQAKAQYRAYSGLISVLPSGGGGTNNLPANTTNTTAITIDTSTAEYVTLYTNFKLVGAGTSNVRFILSRCADAGGVGCETNSNAIITWDVAANGATQVAAVTNILVGGLPSLSLTSIGMNNANALTNLQFQYGFKKAF